MQNTKTQLLFKELDLIDTTISRLDVQIQKGKHYCILIWLGVLGFLLSEKFIKLNDEKLVLPIFLTALIPLLFWIMDFYWRKALLVTSWRQKMVSLYMNSEASKKDNDNFPLLDPVGFVYDESDYPESLRNHNYFKSKPTHLDAVFYKEGKWFFLALIIFSVVLSFMFK